MARKALEALSTRRDGKRMAASTVQRTRGVLVNAMQYAIELRLLNRNPITDLPTAATGATPVLSSIARHASASRTC